MESIFMAVTVFLGFMALFLFWNWYVLVNNKYEDQEYNYAV